MMERGKYPARAHCAKVASYLKSKHSISSSSVIYLEGQKTVLKEDNDEPQPFRQRRSFFYLSGCALPDCHLIYDISTSSLTLFIPPLDPDSVIWSGLPLLPEDALKKYDIDNCLTTIDLPEHIAKLNEKDPKPKVYLKTGTTLSDLTIKFASSPSDYQILHPALDECRVTKDPYEMALLRHANTVSAEAHTAVLRAIPAARNEQDLEAAFIASCISSGAKHQAYHGIFGSGENAATLHYQQNDQPLANRKNILVDAGAEWESYCSDVTRTMPLNGKFDEESRHIYEIVERMQEAAFKLLKAGVRWEDLHVRAHEVAVEGLLAIGILRNGTAKKLMEERVSVAFFPHGLGHYLGMDTHDTGGNPDLSDKDPMFRYLRIRGEIPEGGVVTVEPGVYFCRFIVEPYLKDERTKRFIDEAVLDKYWGVGGVRIEDDVLVTKDGYENLTTAPKGIEDMEKIINGLTAGNSVDDLSGGIFPSLPERGLEFHVDTAPPGETLNPVSVYALALSTLVEVLHQAWDAPAENSKYEDLLPAVAIYVNRFDRSLLTWHVMMSIYFGVRKIRFTLENVSSEIEANSENGTMEILGGDVFNTSSNADDSGEIVDPLDPTVAIDFRHLGLRIPSKYWFRVVMQAVIIIAHDGNTWDHLNAVDEDADCALNIHTLPGQHPDPRQIATSLLNLLQVIRGGLFDELEFTIKIGDPKNRTPVAEGFFFRLKRDQGPTNEIATAR
ncbi:MAG: hypothetical protein Q9170_006244 [Blastenia crenularia]